MSSQDLATETEKKSFEDSHLDNFGHREETVESSEGCFEVPRSSLESRGDCESPE